jgi:cation-transporting ATPase E
VLAIVSVAVPHRGNLGKTIIRFTLPASFLLFVFGLLLYLGTFFAIKSGLANIHEFSPNVISEIAHIANVAPETLTTETIKSLFTHFTAQTVLVSFFSIAGILLLLFAEPPLKWFEAGAPFRKKNPLTLLAAAGLIIAFYVVLMLPFTRSFFQLMPLFTFFHIVIIGALVIWILVQRWVWRRRLLERFLLVEGDPEE